MSNEDTNVPKPSQCDILAVTGIVMAISQSLKTAEQMLRKETAVLLMSVTLAVS